MKDIGIGIVGGGYMGKAHSVAFAAVASVFDTVLMINSSSCVGQKREPEAPNFR